MSKQNYGCNVLFGKDGQRSQTEIRTETETDKIHIFLSVGFIKHEICIMFPHCLMITKTITETIKLSSKAVYGRNNILLSQPSPKSNPNSNLGLAGQHNWS